MGYLTVNIVDEEIFLDDRKKLKDGFDIKIIEEIDPLLVKLASIIEIKDLI